MCGYLETTWYDRSEHGYVGPNGKTDPENCLIFYLLDFSLLNADFTEAEMYHGLDCPESWI